jgi:glycosyltransferase involved in cell wall biosynthesis
VTKKTKILFIIDHFHLTGGTEKHLNLLVRNLDRDKFDCSVMIFNMGSNPLLDQMKECGVQLIHFPLARTYTPLAFIKAVRLAKIFRRSKFDIVQTFHQKSDTFGAVVARLTGVKHIITSKRDMGALKKDWEFFLNRCLKFLFEKVIVVADAVGEMIVEKEGINKSRIITIYNGVDSDLFSPPTLAEKKSAREALGLSPEDFVVGMVAGFRREKSYDVFFEGALKSFHKIPSLKLLTVGTGVLQAHFKEWCNKNGLGSQVIFPGAVSDVWKYLKAMDVGCLIPGMNEGFSNSVLEKMATGLPLIVSNVGGNAEAVDHLKNGYVIPPNNIDAFSNALEELYFNPQKRLEMGKRSRQIVENKFTLQLMCTEHEKLYTSMT